MYLTEFRNCKNKNNAKDFNRELYFMSYIVCNTLNLKGKKDCGVTTFTKICTNYVEDWNEIIKHHYQPYADIKPNPYGMVTKIPMNTFQTEYAFIYELDNFANNMNLWKKNDTDGKIEFLIDKERLEKILKFKKDENGQKVISKNFTEAEIGNAETLSMIYQHFEPFELNILCSFKDINKANWCIEYAFRCWSYDFYNAVQLIKNNGSEKEIMRCISHIARSCEQIEMKTDLIINKMPCLIQRIEDEILPEASDDRIVKRNLTSLYNRLAEEKMAPYFDDRFILVLKQKYKMNREKIYPLNKALISYYKDKYEKNSENYGFDVYKIKKEMKSNINAMKEAYEKPSIITCEENEFESNIEKILDIYNILYEKEYVLLRRYISDGKRKERIDWGNVDDGRLESW